MRWLITCAGCYWSEGVQQNYCFSSEGGTRLKALEKALVELDNRLQGISRPGLYEPYVITSAWLEVIQCP